MIFPQKSSLLIAHISLLLNFAVALISANTPTIPYCTYSYKFGVFERNRYYPTWKDMRYGAFSAFIVIMMFFDGV